MGEGNWGGRTDRISGGVLLLVGLSIIWQASRLRLGSFHTPGPGLYPLLLGSVIVFLSLCLILSSTRKMKEGPSVSGQSLKRVGSVYVALLIYFAVLEYAGFLVSTFFLVSYLSIIIGRQKAVWALLRAFIITGLSYLLFDVALKSDLPKGLLGL
jgi:hypothetical protein